MQLRFVTSKFKNIVQTVHVMLYAHAFSRNIHYMNGNLCHHYVKWFVWILNHSKLPHEDYTETLIFTSSKIKLDLTHQIPRHESCLRNSFQYPHQVFRRNNTRHFQSWHRLWWERSLLLRRIVLLRIHTQPSSTCYHGVGIQGGSSLSVVGCLYSTWL